MNNEPITKPNEHAWWTTRRGASAVVGTAIHDGSLVRDDIAAQMSITDDDRLREEDPFTAEMIGDLPNQVIVHRSRFEVDLNRPRDGAIYVRPEQAWGMRIWREPPSSNSIDQSLRVHESYYSMLESYLRDIEAQHGQFVVLDVHSYNHRRDGPSAKPSPAADAPEVNIGTFSMDRDRWRAVVDAFSSYVREFDFLGRRLDVGENIAFQGRGEQTRFIHERFPSTGCALAIEFKKFFMDEWTGVPDRRAVAALRNLISGSVPVLEKVLKGAP
ncbi:MAG TPA: N-formylglutamate amidohydrolase [Ensifer sp.]|uniref:N-formylglutamate amidohydrolase n=1 Tax=Ensifer sp. TaxID=1872086 RepID=UPI002E0FECA2|nr:N-formylglutamate amidohydrolase [Ensifer sp.]